MIRMIGAALLFLSCTGIGFRIARDYRERPRQIRGLMHAVRVLQTEIEYSVTPLPVALGKVAQRAQAPINRLFQIASELLQSADMTVEAAFREAIAACKGVTALQMQDLEVVREFGKTLGVSDRVHQGTQIKVALEHLSLLEQDARDLQKKNERLWQYLGVLSGLLLLVLLY